MSGRDSHSDASVEGLSLPSYAWGHVPSLWYRDQDDLDRSELRLVKGHHHRPSYAALLAQLRRGVGPATGERSGFAAGGGDREEAQAQRVPGEPGEEVIPGLEKLLLASYYQGAEKRQPPLGFHGSRG
ncbi:uncharacterized protein LOC131937642 [Physella acuta]|uniref:uncharacterized protein LOC131937642 n=1 Tax=Physella acuta TaxID=109671 RepID=UPI0027DC3A10|nr:uncharacterized protein LOC131937642 [Physella acuta]